MLTAACDNKCIQEKVDGSLLEWRSHRIKRVCRSIIAAEAASLGAATDHGGSLAHMLSEAAHADFQA
eukprot:15482847-Alexandrium_andersonii.AAC.1